MKKSLVIGITLVTILGLASISYASTNFTPKTSIEEKKEILEQRVEEGTITKEQANEIETKLENCDGTKQEKIGQEYGVCFGQGNGEGKGYGQNQNNMKNDCTSQNSQKYGNQKRQAGQGKNKNRANCDGTGICKNVVD